LIIESCFNNRVARPRKIDDEHLLAASASVISRFGPAFTLADVATEARVAAGTLVHRFGSRHGLLVALLDSAIASARSRMATAAGSCDAALTEVRTVLVDQYAPLDDPLTAARHLAQLGFDLADNDLRERLAVMHAAVREGLCALLARAAVDGELPGAPPAGAAARILAAAADGTALHWSACPEGSLRERLATDIDAILAGWQGKENR
jgi:AcrR family transcriptional regulator